MFANCNPRKLQDVKAATNENEKHKQYYLVVQNCDLLSSKKFIVKHIVDRYKELSMASPANPNSGDEQQTGPNNNSTQTSQQQHSADTNRGKAVSLFLQKRLQKGQKYFDSGDYNMAKATKKRERELDQDLSNN